MRHKITLSILCFLLLLGLNSFKYDNTNDGLISESDTISYSIQTIYSPITIDGNSEFVTMAEANGWNIGGRDGSIGNPYLIEKPEISGGGTGIYILNTDLYFIIESGDFTGNTQGIYLSGVSHATISNSYINHTGSNGINIHYCSDITITKNTISNYTFGIWVYESDNIVIEDSTISEAEYGFYLWHNDNVDVKNSHISNIREAGIRIEGNHYNVSGNTITNVWDTDSKGILGDILNDSVIMGNTITDTANVGIYLDNPSYRNTINENILNNTGYYGINLNSLGVTNNSVNGNFVSYTSSTGIHTGSWNSFNSNTVQYTYSAFVAVSNNIISHNTINHSTGNGITMNGNDNILEGNVVHNSGLSGIYCGTSNTGNGIRGNTVVNSSDAGLYLYSTGLITLEDNVFIANNENLLLRGSKFEHFDYEISNNSFDGEELIFIKDQENFVVPANFWRLLIVNSSNFELSESTVNSGESVGVTIAFSSDFSVKDNVFSNVSTGLELIGVRNAQIVGNQVYNCSKTGIYSYNSSNVLFMENEIYSNVFNDINEPSGIYLKISEDSMIYSNNIHDNEGWGLMSNGCSDIVFEGNILSNNSLGGIYSWFDEFNTYTHNYIETTDFYGIRLRTSNNNSVYSNNINDCGFYGLYVENSEYNSISFNEFHNNSAHAFDNDVGNIFDYNYWDNHTSPDIDTDLIVDDLYSFATNQDLHPLVNPFVLSTPDVLTPNGGEVLNETISIEWTASTDSLAFLITYSVFYSNDGGILWTELVTELAGTTYEWDSKGFANSTYYKLKIKAINSIGLYSEDSSDGIFTVLNVAHALTVPSFLFPAGEIAVSGIINIQWNPVVDSWHESMSVTYAIYVSSDGGLSWTLLANSLPVPAFLWDTEITADGSDYLFKVVATSGDGLVREAITPSTFTINNAEIPTSTTTTNPSFPTTTEVSTETTPTSGSTEGWTLIPLLLSIVTIWSFRKKKK